MSELHKEVREIVLSHNDNPDEIKNWLDDLNQHGCASGMVSDLIYYDDTCSFYDRHKKEISECIAIDLEECGLKSIGELLRDYDTKDYLAESTHNKNLLAWYAFERTCDYLRHSEMYYHLS